MSVKSGRRTGKRLLSFLLGLCMMIGLMPVTAMAADQPSYVVLGDSISTGYGLDEGKPSFAAQLAEKNNLAMTLLAKDGATSEDLYNVVSSTDNEKTIKNADVITITIGGNDMMDALYEYLAVEYNAEKNPTPAWTAEDVKETITDSKNPNYDDLISVAFGSISGFPDSEQAKNKAQIVGVKLSEALGKIKELNSDVTIIVSNQYNPYTFAATEAAGIYIWVAPIIVTAFEDGIKLLNDQLSAATTTNNCTLADVYTKINSATQNPCNASFANELNLDFHPNAYGHTLIANTLQPYFDPVVQRYSLTVTNGMGGGDHWKGRKVELTADEAPAGQHFVSWQIEPATYETYFEDIDSETTTFTMPADNIQITAGYEDHELTHHAEVPATCTGSGTKEYWECSDCGGIYSDEDGTQPVTVDDLVINLLGHDLGEWSSNGDNTHTRICQRDGCDYSETNTCQGGTANYFKKAVCEDCGAEYGELLTDVTAPEGTISIAENEWKSFLNQITFGLFFKETQDVTITASDDSMGQDGYTEDKAPKISYYISSEVLSFEELKNETFECYMGKFSISNEGRYVIYAKITDHAGNETYISSEGLVMDQTDPAVTGLENGKTYCGPVEVTVSDEYLDMVTVNGSPAAVTEGKFTVAPVKGEQTIVVTDKAGNSITYKVTVNAGHTFTTYVSDDNAICTADGTETATCEFCDETDTRTDAGSALGHNLSKWESNGEKHWQTCDRCSEKLNEEEHSYTSEIDSTCDICGYIRDVDPVAVLDSEILFRELTDGVDGTTWDTADKVKERLISILKEKGYSEENVSFCDAVLTGTLTVNGKVLEEGVDFSAKDTEFTVVIPYPEGTDEDTKDFTVLHMFSASSDVLETTAGDTEMLEPVKLENGLQVTLNGLSPVAVAWSVDSQAGTDAGTNSGNNDASDVDKNTDAKAETSTVPETGDNAPVAPFVVIMVLCVAVIGFAVYRKRSKNKR